MLYYKLPTLCLIIIGPVLDGGHEEHAEVLVQQESVQEDAGHEQEEWKPGQAPRHVEMGEVGGEAEPQGGDQHHPEILDAIGEELGAEPANEEQLAEGRDRHGATQRAERDPSGHVRVALPGPETDGERDQERDLEREPVADHAGSIRATSTASLGT